MLGMADGGSFEMASGGENECGDEDKENDRRRWRDRKRRKEQSNSESENEEERYVVGMRAEVKADGIFGNQHEVGKFIEKRVGKVKSVRVTRGGTVIIECRNCDQSYKAIMIRDYGETPVATFHLGTGGIKKRKGVISGVPLTVKPELFEREVEDVYEARRLSRYREGQREDTMSMCLTFEGELPERIYVGYVTYRVRPYERGPIRCFCCQEYGHVAAVCRGVRRCGRCGKEKCDEKCVTEEPACLHCNGAHFVGSAECPKRKEEDKVNRIRMDKTKRVTYAEALKRMDEDEKADEKADGNGKRETDVVKKRDERNLCMDKRQFLAFIAMVINCAIEMQGKSERIKMVLEAARRFLNIEDITGEDLDNTLRGVSTNQTNGSE